VPFGSARDEVMFLGIPYAAPDGFIPAIGANLTPMGGPITGRSHFVNAIYIGDLALGNAALTPQCFTPDDWYDVFTSLVAD
jgi:hypothetical protein